MQIGGHPARARAARLAAAAAAVVGTAGLVTAAVVAPQAEAAATAAAPPLSIDTYAGAVCSPRTATAAAMEPLGVIGDGQGGFLATNSLQSVVCHVASDGTISLVAGNGGSGYGFDGGNGGPATNANLYDPSGI